MPQTHGIFFIASDASLMMPTAICIALRLTMTCSTAREGSVSEE